MKYALIVLGEKLKDPELNDFIQSSIRAGNEVKVFAPAIEHLDKLTKDCEFDVIWIETNGCEKDRYIKAINNLITLIFARAKVITFMPLCPKKILSVAKEQWPGAQIYIVDYKRKQDPVRLY